MAFCFSVITGNAKPDRIFKRQRNYVFFLSLEDIARGWLSIKVVSTILESDRLDAQNSGIGQS